MKVLGGPGCKEWSEAGKRNCAERKKTKTVIFLVQNHSEVEPSAASNKECPISQHIQELTGRHVLVKRERMIELALLD